MDKKTDQQIVQDCIDRGVPIPKRQEPYRVEQIQLRADQYINGQPD